jgi:hypothetical protein
MMRSAQTHLNAARITRESRARATHIAVMAILITTLLATAIHVATSPTPATPRGVVTVERMTP